MRTSKRSNQSIVSSKYSVFTLLVVLATGFAFPVPSIAKSDNNGAYTFKDSYCFPYEDITVCYANSGVVKGTTTPSGNTAFVGIGSNSYIEFDSLGTVIYSDALTYHTTGLTIDDALFQLAQAFSEALIIGSYTCTTKYHLQLVKGEIVFERSSSCF